MPRRRLPIVGAMAATVAVTVLALLAPGLGDTSASTGGSTARAGIIPKGEIVGLGDSVMAADLCGCDSYLTRYADALGRQRGVTLRTVNLGADGLTAADMVDRLRTDPITQAAVRQARIIVLTVGANDLEGALDTFDAQSSCPDTCVAAAVGPMRRDLDNVVSEIHRLRATDARLIVTTYWNVFAVGTLANTTYGDGYAQFSQQITSTANAAICAVAASHDDTCVDLWSTLGAPAEQPGNLLPDGDHPNDASNALISSALLAAS